VTSTTAKLEWEIKPISEACTVNPSKREIKDLPVDIEVSFVPMPYVSEKGKIEQTDIKKLSDVKNGFTYFRDGDVIVAKITPCFENGKKAVAENLKNGIGFGSTEFHVLRAKDGVLPKWLYFAVSRNEFRQYSKMRMTGAVGQKRVPKTVFDEQLVPVPTEDEQQLIVDELETQFTRLDATISSLQAVKKKLDVYRKSVLNSLIDNKLNNQVCLVDISNKITDGEHLRPNFTNSGVPFLSAKDVRSDGVSFESCKYISTTDAEIFRKKCKPEEGDILMVSRGATVGRTCIVNSPKEFCLLGSVILIKKPASMYNKYLYYYLISPAIQEQLINISGSTAQQAIYIRDVKNLKVSTPDKVTQNKIVTEIESRFSVIDKLEETVDKALSRAELLGKSILKSAFEGKLVSMVGEA